MKKKKIEIRIPKDRIGYKTSDLLRMIKESYSDFYDTSDSQKKIEYLGEMIFGFIVYSVMKNDYQNYIRVFLTPKEDK